MAGPYDDIIGLSRPVSKKHAPMSVEDRAAQFASFAALTGHDAAVKEKARLTDSWVELDEDTKISLDRRLMEIAEHIEDHPVVLVEYFEKDLRKKGGAYIEKEGAIKKIDTFERALVFEDDTRISMNFIVNLEEKK